MKTVQKELTLTREKEPVSEWYAAKKGWHLTQKYRYQNDIEYHKKYHLNWVQGVETRNQMKQRETNTPPPQPEHSTFEYVTNIRADREKV